MKSRPVSTICSLSLAGARSCAKAGDIVSTVSRMAAPAIRDDLRDRILRVEVMWGRFATSVPTVGMQAEAGKRGALTAVQQVE